jgi:hypothetical protein
MPLFLPQIPPLLIIIDGVLSVQGFLVLGLAIQAVLDKVPDLRVLQHLLLLVDSHPTAEPPQNFLGRAVVGVQGLLFGQHHGLHAVFVFGQGALVVVHQRHFLGRDLQFGLFG